MIARAMQEADEAWRVALRKKKLFHNVSEIDKQVPASISALSEEWIGNELS